MEWEIVDDLQFVPSEFLNNVEVFLGTRWRFSLELLWNVVLSSVAHFLVGLDITNPLAVSIQTIHFWLTSQKQDEKSVIIQPNVRHYFDF